jgi:D-inositol-3-phosphate glycosyltransferase
MAAMTLNPLRIAMLSVHSSPMGPLGTQNTGGMSVYVRELARWLGFQGHQIDIFTYGPGPCRHMDLYLNVRLIYLAQADDGAWDKEQLPAHLETIADALERYRHRQAVTYDVIHSHYWISAVVGAMAQKRWHCPHLTMFHTLGAVKNHTSAGEDEPIRRIAHERWLAKATDGIVVPASGERHNLLCHYHPRPEIIHTIPCGVDLDLFQPQDRLTARRELGLAADAQMALYVGRFAPVKGIDNLLGAVARLKHRLPKLHLVVVGGDGPDAESTRALTRQVHLLRMAERVTFAGRIAQASLPRYYSAADFVALPSHYESFGLVVLEALACGTPVVATRVGAAATLIKEGLNGVLIDSPDEAAVARAITRMVKALPPLPGSQSKIRATAGEFDWQRVAVSVMQVYGLLLEAQAHSRTSGPAATQYPVSN